MAFIFRKAEPANLHELTDAEIGQVAGGHTELKLETTVGGGPWEDDGTECD